MFYKQLISLSCFFICFTAFSSEPESIVPNHSFGFIENKGQIVDQDYQPRPDVHFIHDAGGLKTVLRTTGFSYEVYSIEEHTSNATEEEMLMHPELEHPATTVHSHRIDIELLGANPNAKIIREGASKDYINYYTAGTPENGALYVRKHQQVTYKEIYPHIDLVFKLKNNKPKYDFVLRPGANINDIKLQYKGGPIALYNGELIIETSQGKLVENIPESYYLQVKEKNKKEASVEYVLFDNVVTLKKRGSNKQQTLIIDPTPVIEWGNYFGGTAIDDVRDIDEYADGIYTCGNTYSSNNITTSGAFQQTFGGQVDAFLNQFDTDGSIIWSTYYGNTLWDLLFSVVVTSKAVYTSGQTESSVGIATNGAHQTVFGGGTHDAMLLKFNHAGQRIWGTYYGGNDIDYSQFLTVDELENLYLVGSTMSDNAISTTGTHQLTRAGDWDVFIAKLDSSGTQIWGTYYGGIAQDYAAETDYADGLLYLTGLTLSSSGISTTNTISGMKDCFISKFDTTGSLLWGGYFGGSFDDYPQHIVVDNVNQHDLYVVGKTESTNNIATSGTHQLTLNGVEDGFIAKFDSSGINIWGTYYGGDDDEVLTDIVLDENGELLICGRTTSTSHIATGGAHKEYIDGSSDGFISKFSSSGKQIWGSYFGGTDSDFFYAIDYTSNQQIIAGGVTRSSDSIAVNANYQGYWAGNNDGFIVKFNNCYTLSPQVTGLDTIIYCEEDSATLASSLAPNYQWYLWDVLLTGETDQTLKAYATGKYTVQVVDSIGCEAISDSITVINQSYNPLISPTSLDSVYMCSGDSVLLSSFWTENNYQWLLNGFPIALATDSSYYATQPGNYQLAVVDVFFCLDTTEVFKVKLASFDTSSTNETCHASCTGTATAEVLQGNSPSYQWDSNTGNQTTPTATGLCVGTYSVTVTTDSCTEAFTFTIDTFLLTAVTSAYGESGNQSDGKATATPNGGTPPYTYLWDANAGNQTTQTATGLSTGIYFVTITDDVGCSEVFSVDVPNWPVGIQKNIQAEGFEVFPNPTKGKFTVSTSKQGVIYITDVTGRQVKQAKPNEILDLSQQPNGVYFLRFVMTSGESLVKRVEVIR